MRYLKVSPHSSNYKAEDVLFIDTEEHPIGGLELSEWLLKGESFNHEAVFNDRIANAKVEDYGDTEEEATNAINSEVAQEFCELLNYVQHATGCEVSLDSDFELTDSNTLDEEDENEEDGPKNCPTCGDEMDKDCQGQPRCPTCDPPCPSCYDGGGPV